MKILDYVLLHSESAGWLQQAVAQGIKDGWQPFGPPVGANAEWAQAMVLYREV